MIVEVFCAAIHRKDWAEVSDLMANHGPEIKQCPYFKGAVEVKFPRAFGAVVVKQSDWREITNIQKELKR